MWKYSSFWFKDFDGMALKTMLRQLISKWGIMSIDLQTAIDKDMAVIQEDGSVEYVENDSAEYEENIVSDQEFQEVENIKKDEAIETDKQESSVESNFFN